MFLDLHGHSAKHLDEMGRKEDIDSIMKHQKSKKEEEPTICYFVRNLLFVKNLKQSNKFCRHILTPILQVWLLLLRFQPISSEPGNALVCLTPMFKCLFERAWRRWEPY